MLPSRLNSKENGKIYVKKEEVVELKQMLFSILGKNSLVLAANPFLTHELHSCKVIQQSIRNKELCTHPRSCVLSQFGVSSLMLLSQL